MKRTPLSRKTPMRRAAKTRPSSHGGDLVYLARVRSLPCCVCRAPPPSHAHHETGWGMGLKAPDRRAFPLCAKDHRDFHDGKGRFDGWTANERRVWQEEEILEMQSIS